MGFIVGILDEIPKMIGFKEQGCTLFLKGGSISDDEKDIQRYRNLPF